MTVGDDLTDDAEAAEDVAAALFPFLNSIPECGHEISAVMSELFGISSMLRELAKCAQSRSYERWTSLIVDDLDLALPSFALILKDVDRLFERLAITPHPGARAYLRVWREIRSMLGDGSTSFVGKLKTFRYFFEELCSQVKGLRPEYDMLLLRRQILDIRHWQDDQLDYAFVNLSLEAAVIEVSAESPIDGPMSPEIPLPSPPPRPPPRPPMPGEYYGMPPLTPDLPPMSPTTTLSSSSSGVRPHWAVEVFDGLQPNTPFSSRGLPSSCLGPHVEGAEFAIAQTHEKLVELHLDRGGLHVKLYWNPRDNRAKIICLSGSHYSEITRTESWSPVNLLGVSRYESCLRLYHTDPSSRERIQWACLRFATWEWMVLFFCTITALRARGPQDMPMSSGDYRLEGEIEYEVFQIEDDDFLHKLRILKDRDSGGVRLEAVVMRGELRRTPVWTVFVTQHIGGHSWAHRVDARIIQLANFKPYIFCPDYEPQWARNGKFELRFLTSEDAARFMHITKSLKQP